MIWGVNEQCLLGVEHESQVGVVSWSEEATSDEDQWCGCYEAGDLHGGSD
jgi:hypothetical protein